MAVTLNASTTAGLVQTADTSGVLALQTAGTTAVSIDASQVVTLTNALPEASGGTGSTTVPHTITVYIKRFWNIHNPCKLQSNSVLK
jgi:hypothetical protein